MSPSFLKAFKSSRYSKNSKKTKETNDTKDTKDAKDAKRPTNLIKKLSSKTSTGPPRTITAFASAHGGKTFVEKSIELPTLGRNDVGVAIICCSVCYTDTLYAAMYEDHVVGHEIIGRVESKGEDVTNVEVGDIVGFGYIRSTCLNCKHCHSGQENLCERRTTFSEGVGGFANASVWDSRFVYKIPESIEPRHAGPLTCAGASVFGALYGYNVSPTATVGVVGIGGLGHLAIKFARAWGCKVVAISANPDKRRDAVAFGAHEFVCLKDSILNTTKLDYILNTAANDPPWDHIIGLLEANGTLINLGVSRKGSMDIPHRPHLFKQLKVGGSLVASRHVIVKMLEFAARHNIKPEIEELEMGVEGCNEAFHRITHQQARYRIVLNVPRHLTR
ncbi:hypothetical protein BGZ59_000159 [Podila verticillata]|uniref:Enoyl reductase (ER) domain-containing protein n=1 Tax=Podila verticillata NRRL 6337 TaxID=1069443 RepID=A0A086TKG1_9FUNG|nr:hypothetical protein BGZ59_000159 [Podila verticillata]KFH62438.1 hypothetical protein MVEG_11647 [Podila verticillata NRRL 6337]